MTFETLKQYIDILYGDYVSDGNVISTTGSSPTPLALLLDLVHSDIMAHPEAWYFQREKGTINLDGSLTYDLNTLFPDANEFTQLYGVSEYKEEHNHGPNEGNITPFQGYHIDNGVLTFNGNAPGSGTAYIDYISTFLVKDSSGNRKLYFENNDDVTVLKEAHKPVLIYGIGKIVNWKMDEVSQSKKQETISNYENAYNKMLLKGEHSRPLTSML